MLTIRRDQMAILDADLFERWMEQHLQQFFPELCVAHAPAALRQLIRTGMHKARAYGLVEKSDVAGFVDLVLVLGKDFDQDPALPWADGVLRDPCASPAAARLASLRHFAHEWLSTGTVTSSVFTPSATVPSAGGSESGEQSSLPPPDRGAWADDGDPAAVLAHLGDRSDNAGEHP